MLYEIDRISRFPEVGNFLSYSRRVRCEHESAGKKKGSGGKKIGNAHLKWAFSEAACLMVRSMPAVKSWLARREKKGGKKKALAVLEAKIGRTVYHLWRKQGFCRRFDDAAAPTPPSPISTTRQKPISLTRHHGFRPRGLALAEARNRRVHTSVA